MRFHLFASLRPCLPVMLRKVLSRTIGRPSTEEADRWSVTLGVAPCLALPGRVNDMAWSLYPMFG